MDRSFEVICFFSFLFRSYFPLPSCFFIVYYFHAIMYFLNLTFICPCGVNVIPNYNQQDATFLDLFISTDALHISGGSSAHHQEHITVPTASSVIVAFSSSLHT